MWLSRLLLSGYFCVCPYAAVLSSVGLGFLISTAYLLPFTIAFFILTLIALAFRANQRRGYGPLGLGLVGSAAVLIGKFYLDSNSAIDAGIAFLVAAAIWNVWPRRVAESCPCKTTNEGE
jgi:hypothetical protein